MLAKSAALAALAVAVNASCPEGKELVKVEFLEPTCEPKCPDNNGRNEDGLCIRGPPTDDKILPDDEKDPFYVAI
jgi:hypothetical protein